MGQRKDYLATPHTVEKTCEVCGKVKRIDLSNFKVPGFKGRFCGMACKAEWQKGKRFKNGGYTAAQGRAPYIRRPPQRQPFPASAVVAAEYQRGDTLQQIADRYGGSVSCVCYHLDKMGVQRRKTRGRGWADPAVRANMKHRYGAEHHRFHELPVDEIRDEYEGGRSTSDLGRQYGVSAVTISRKLKQIGVQMRPPGYTETRQCSDGHVVQSTYEVAVDEWLASHGVQHTVHPYCPWYKGGKSGERADFQVGDVFIEVWGIAGSARYEARRQEKTAKYREAHAPLIQIFPHHIHDEDFSPLEVLLPPE